MDVLFTTEQIATYCGISYQHLRKCFAEGVIPEPKHSFRHKRSTVRKFTQAEADKLRAIFADTRPNKFKDKRRRARVYKQITGKRK